MTYDTSGNYATAKTNQAGNTVYYSYDVNGNVTSAEDGEENQTVTLIIKTTVWQV